MSTEPPRPRLGRPPKFQGRKMPYEEVDRLLVEGELVEGPDGIEVRVWPTQREVAKRYGVSPGLIGSYATQMNARARREAFQAGKPLPPRTLADRSPTPAPAADTTLATGSAAGAETAAGGESTAATETSAATETAPVADVAEALLSDEDRAPDRPRRRPGRPRKAEAPLISLEELDRLLVFGEVVQTPDGAATTRYPTYRELAERYGVAVSYVAAYVKSHNCLRRRDEAKVRLALRVEDKLIEKRAEAMAVGKDDVVRLIDEFLLGFLKALKEGRVRQDNPSDVNTFVRLKEFILGGADSRQELHAALSLESIQQRYARMLQDRRDDPALTGAVDGSLPRPKLNVLVESNSSVLAQSEEPRPAITSPDSPPPFSDASAAKPHNYEGLYTNGGLGLSTPLLNAGLSTVLVLARELCEQLDAVDADDETLLEVRLLRAVEGLERRLDPARGAHVAPRRAADEEDEP